MTRFGALTSWVGALIFLLLLSHILRKNSPTFVGFFFQYIAEKIFHIPRFLLNLHRNE